MSQDYLNATVEVHGGEPLRFGGDEPLAERVIQRPSLSTQMPGGFAEAGFVVARPDSISAIDSPRFELAPVRIYGDGARVAYEGRIVGIPQIGTTEIELRLEGHSAHLSDDETLTEIFVDRDLGGFRGSSRAREIQLLGAGQEPRQLSPIPDTSAGLTTLGATLSSVATGVVVASAGWYDAGPSNRIKSVQYQGQQTANVLSTFSAYVYGMTADDGTAFNEVPAGDTLASSGATTYAVTTVSFTGSYRFVMFHFDTPASPGAGPFGFMFRHVALFGDHGLTKRGTAPDQGYYASDIIAHALSAAAPGLTYTAGDSIEQGTFVIPHLVYRDGTTALQVIEDVTALGGGASLVNDWGVYEDREFFWKTPGTYGTTWRIRKDEAAEPSSEGPDVRERANGVVVTYQDTAGTTHTVGPPGSGADTESDDLEDTSDENPCNLAGIRRWRNINAGLTVEDGAVLIGRLALLEANADKRKGSFTHTGKITDEAGNTAPPWMVRAGDRVVIEDGDDRTEQRILTTSYDDDSYTVQGSIGGVADRLDALLGRLLGANQASGF